MCGTTFFTFTILLSLYQVSSRTFSNENEVESTLEDLSPLLNSLNSVPDLTTSIRADLHSIVLVIPSFPSPQEEKRETVLNPDALKSIADRIKDRIDALVKEAAVKVEDLQDKTDCIRKSVSAARQEATQGMLDVGRCAVNATTKANDAIQPVIAHLEEEIMKLGPLAKKIGFNILDCRKDTYHIECIKDVLTSGEKELISIAEEIRANLRTAGQTWNNLLQDLRRCFLGGTEHATVIEKELRVEIRECLE